MTHPLTVREANLDGFDAFRAFFRQAVGNERTANSLMGGGVFTVPDIAARTNQELLAMYGMGKTCLRIARETVQRHGL